MDYIAGISGATLGYISNGRRGVKQGWSLGYNLSKRKHMAPITRRSGRRPSGSTASIYVTPVSRNRRASIVSKSSTSSSATPLRRMSLGSSVSASRFRGRGRSFAGGNHSYRSLASNASALKVRGRGMKRKRVPKVSKAFKRKVNAALVDHISGKYMRISTGHVDGAALPTGQQIVVMGNEFSPTDLLHAADVLFNGATPSLTPTITWNNSYVRQDFVQNTRMFYEVKNTSQRTYTLKFYECAPKQAATASNSGSAFDDWNEGLAYAYTQGTNPQQNTPNTLFSVPTDSPQFVANWKAKLTTVVLQPGETHTFFVQGPNQQSIDWSKVIAKAPAGVAYVPPYEKWSRSLFLVLYMDLVTSTGSSAGRYPSGVGVGGLVVEKRQIYTIQCPASAGFQYPAAFAGSTNQQLTNKRPVKVIKNFTPAISGTVLDVLDENPNNQANFED